MASAYVEVILGVTLGGIVGVVPAAAAGLSGAVAPSLPERRYGLVIVAVLALPVAGAVGTLGDVVVLTLEQTPRIVASVPVVAFLSIYGLRQGATVGRALRRRGVQPVESGRSLSAAAIDAVDASGQVTITPAGAIQTITGYPPLPAALRDAVAADRWRLPADLPLSELEARVEAQLRREYDLQAVDVTVDPRGTATVAAAPPETGIARLVPENRRAVSITATVPEAVAPGDQVLVANRRGLTEGELLSARRLGDRATHDGETGTSGTVKDRGEIDPPRERAAAGEGRTAGSHRLTIAVATADADALLADPVATVAVRSRDTRPDFRALSLLDRAGQVVRVTTLDADLLDAVRDDRVEIDVFAARPPAEDVGEDWRFDPDEEALDAGWESVLVGDRTSVNALVDSSPNGEGVIHT